MGFVNFIGIYYGFDFCVGCLVGELVRSASERL